MTFDKRLEAHQKAFYWCQQLNQVLNIGESSEIHRIAAEARQWWNGNCLLLDRVSRQKMIGLFNLAHMYARQKQGPAEPKVQTGEGVWERLDESFKAIMEGIGTEYLPEMESRDKTDKD